MKRNKAGHRNYSHLRGGHAKAYRAYLAALEMDLRSNSLASLETQHRLSWKKYIVSLVVPLLISTLFLGVAEAADKTLTEAPVSSPDAGLTAKVSRETQKSKTVIVSAVKPAVPAPSKSLTDIGKIVRPAVKASEEKNKDEKVAERTVTGVVMFIRKNMISVEFNSGAQAGGEDRLLSLDENVKVKNIKDFSKIKRGDRVEVKYEETYLEPKEIGGEPTILKTLGREITLLKNAPLVSETLAIVSAENKGIERE